MYVAMHKITNDFIVEPVLGFFETYKRVFRNTPYVLIQSVYTLHVTAITIVSGIAIYYFKYIHNDEPKTTGKAN